MIGRIVEGVTVATTTSDEASGDTQPSIGELVQEASTQFSAVLHGEIELAKLELRSSVKNAGAGVGMFAGAVVLLVFALVFGFIALAEGIAVAADLSRWAGYLIVFGFLLVLIGLLVFLGIKRMKRIKAPERTIATSKETVAALKHRA
jgi:uncharacterized membrane protein YqjE